MRAYGGDGDSGVQMSSANNAAADQGSDGNLKVVPMLIRGSMDGTG
jgi:hypothetical protein